MMSIFDNAQALQGADKRFFFQTAGMRPPGGIYFGINILQDIGDLAAQFESSKALLITDKVILNLGYAAVVRKSLDGRKIPTDVFSQVEPEPKMSTAEALCDRVRKGNYDLIIGLGGGSAIDLAKLASIMGTNHFSPFEFMSKGKIAVQPGLKKILIPTTSGSGSEVSRYIVVSSDTRKYGVSSPFVYADCVIIDPTLTLSMPPEITAFTGIDALSHAIDAMMNKYENPFFDSIALGAIELISTHLRKAFFNGNDIDARYHMSMGATMAMLAMDGKGVALYSHSISYVLSSFQPISHGIGCGIALPFTMASNLYAIPNRLARIACSMGVHTETIAPSIAAQRAVEFVYHFIKELGLPLSLRDLGYKRSDLRKMAEVCMTKHKREYNPKDMTVEDCEAIFEAMWEGSPERLYNR